MSTSSAVLQRKSENSCKQNLLVSEDISKTICSQFLNYFFLKEIDEYIVQAKERSYETMVSFGKQGLSIAATAAVSAAVKASYCYIYSIFIYTF